jgi:hypothetical protein
MTYRHIRREEDGICGDYLIMSEDMLVVCGVNGCTGGTDKGYGVPGAETGHGETCGLEGEEEQQERDDCEHLGLWLWCLKWWWCL